MREKVIPGVLLTGGKSRRLGVDKARLVFDGEPLAVRSGRVLNAVCEMAIEVGDGVSNLSHVREQPVGEGPLAALLAGVDEIIRRDASIDGGVLLLACDLPRMTETVLLRVLDDPHSTSIPNVSDRLQYGCAKYGEEMIAEMRDRFRRGERSFRWIQSLDLAIWAPVEDTDQQIEGWTTAFRDIDTPQDAADLGINLKS